MIQTVPEPTRRLLACPVCKGALDFAPGMIRCPACPLDFPQRTIDCIDLLARTLWDPALTWVRRRFWAGGGYLSYELIKP